LVLSTTSTNAVIRYFLITNSSQTSASVTNVPSSTNGIVYTGPIPINQTTQIRARAFEPNKLPSTPVSVTYIQIDQTVLNFSSDLPMVIIHTFGSASISGSGDGTGYCMIFDNNLDRSSLTNPPSTSTRIGVNDRGSSTAGQAKQNMAVEFWDEFNQDIDRPFLDMPAESDWVMYGINGYDPGLMHNAIFHWFGRGIGRYSSKTRYVEVFRKLNSGPIGTNDYFGLYLVEEKPKRSSKRVDIPALQLENTNLPSLSGGYLLKIDRNDPDERIFQPPQVGGITTTPAPIEFVHPNVTPQTTDPRRLIQINYIQNYIMNFITNLDSVSFTNPVTGYAKYIDVDSWVENHIANSICFNVDGYRLSGFFFKDRDKKMEMGPPWDCDRCLGTGGSSSSLTPQTDNRPFNPRVWRPYTVDPGSDQGTDFFNRSTVGVSWWYKLFRDPDFWQKWIDRYQAFRTNEFTTAKVMAMVDGYYQEIKEAQVREQLRWTPPPVGKQQFSWPRSGFQSVTFSAGGFSSTYAYDFGPTNPLSSTISVKVGYYTNEVNFQKKWLADRLEFIDTNFLAMPTVSLGTSPVTNGTTVTVQVAPDPGTVLRYTLDGTDPRLPGGAINPAALTSAGNLTLNISQTVRLFARCYNGTHANVTNSALVGNPPLNSYWSGPIDVTYYTSVPPLRITELMYHPPKPPAGNTNDADLFEYIEVQNTGATPLNVNRFRISGGVDFQFPNTLLNPGQFAVIVRDPVQFASRYGAGPLVLGSYSNNLANDGDHLILEGGFREPILDFTYDDKWYPITDGNGFSLQIVDAGAPTSTWGLASSWRPSGVVNGTPGAADPGAPATPVVYVNEASTHTDPFPADAIELYNSGGSVANIGGWFLTDDFDTPKKYRIPDGTTIPANGYVVFYQSNSFGFGLSSKGDSVWVFSGDANTNLTGYFHGFDFGPQALGRTFGRYVISTGEDHFPSQSSPTLGGPNSGPLVGPVVITEINYHPVNFLYPKTNVDNTIDEYIELQNISGTPAALYDDLNPHNTWRLGGGIGFSFPEGTVIPAGAYALVVSFTPTNGPTLDAFRAAVGAPPTVPVYGPWTGKLNNSEDTVELNRPDLPDASVGGLVAYIQVDKVHYLNTAPWPTGGADGLGASIQRVNPSAYGNDPTNWLAALKSPGSGLPTGGATPPTVTVQPVDTVGNETYSASFSVSATGSQPLGYQWLFNGQPIRGGINRVLTINNLRLNQAGDYSCVVLNSAGSVLSGSAHLTVRQVVRIAQHPADVRMRGSSNVVDYGFTTNNANFNVSATGTGTLHYQWRYNGSPIPGANSPAVVIPNVGLTNEGLYDVVITDDIAPVASLPARLTVLITPGFVLTPPQAPSAITVVSNGSFTASTIIRGNPPPFRYEWREVSAVRASTTTTNTTNFFTSGLITNKLPTQSTTWRLVVFNDANTSGSPVSFNVVALADSNGDGVPDDWETQYGLPPGSGGADTDGDGMSNYEEYVAGTDPTNRLSNLRVDLTTLPEAAVVQVGVAAGHTYTLQYSDSLTAPSWRKLSDIVSRPTSRIEQVPDPGYTSNRFYRVVAPVQP
ncbi:MAG TPA: lamin tail domain-containing protein, partial [Candidatus Saccharimonadales bacterium]|nr:lamin tail domain-containing protein [Candidatus Saccharimonadales bacterium]